MTRIEEIEKSVESLSKGDYRRFRAWFLQLDWERWDREIEADSKSGKLDFLVREAREAKESGKIRDL